MNSLFNKNSKPSSAFSNRLHSVVDPDSNSSDNILALKFKKQKSDITAKQDLERERQLSYKQSEVS